MIKKTLNKIYIKREFILKLIIININNFIFFTKKKALSFIIFPFKAMKAIKNIIFGFLWKDLQYISKGSYLGTQCNQRKAICIGFTEWKRAYFQEYIPNKDAYYLHNYIPASITIAILKKLEKDYDVYIWSYLERKELSDFFKTNDILINRVEDGFVRSIGLGANQTKPLSLVIDSEGLYFNAQEQSGLESIILKNSQNYTAHEIKIARDYIDEINTKKITKYNFKNTTLIDNLDIYLDIEKKTVLVIGQVEDDMSIKLGTNEKITNLDLVELAYQENQNCNIIFKPHPDILHKKRNNNTNIEDYAKFALVVTDNFALFDLISISDHVYTITSLSGFEALLQGKKVTCFGSPFYAHWGLTDDRSNMVERRKNCTLTIEQLFYASYIEYPKYFLGGLSQTINAIEEFEHAKEFTFNDSYQFFDYSLAPISFKSDFKNSSNQKIAFITASEKISQLYIGIKSIYKKTTVFTLTNAETIKILETKLVNPKDIVWLARAYATPLSKIEEQSVITSTKISKTYKILLNTLIDDIFVKNTKENLTSAISLGLADRLYDQCAILESLASLSDEYDRFDIYIDPYQKIDVFTKLLLSKIDNNKIYFVINKKQNIKNFQEFLKNQEDGTNHTSWLKKLTADKVKITFLFKNLWHHFLLPDNNQEVLDINDERQKKAIVCGNLTDRNYAYYPASVEILKILDDLGLKTSFVASHNTTIASMKKYSWLLFEISSNIEFINTSSTLVDKKFITQIKPIIEYIEKSLLLSIEKNISYQTSDFLKVNIIRSLTELPAQLLFFSKLLEVSKNSSMFVTTMDRSIYSRLATLAAQTNKILTIGVQPQVISTSRRYKIPVVDYMCVIDEMQKENYYELGFQKDKMIDVGSANLRKHLQQIKDEETISLIKNSKNTTLLFIMQHSMSTLMIHAVTELVNICKNSDLFLYIKPHPHQEVATIKKTASLIEDYQNMILLTSLENTYLYIKNCDIIVGLFSSAVFEAILSGKDVVILKDQDIDKSIDFSLLNISLSSAINSEIKDVVLDYIDDTKSAIQVRINREKYIANSKYYFSNDVLVNNLKKWSNYESNFILNRQR